MKKKSETGESVRISRAFFRERKSRSGRKPRRLVRVTEADYLAAVLEKRDLLNILGRAEHALGIRSASAWELPPVCFEGFCFGPDVAHRWGGLTSSYEVTWLFCGEERLSAYRCRFSMTSGALRESAESFAYEAVTNTVYGQDWLEMRLASACGWTDAPEDCRRFAVYTAGGMFTCPAQPTEASARRAEEIRLLVQRKKRRGEGS